MGKFREYLFKYASDNPNTKKEINDIYKLRSNIVHTGMLFLGDNKIDWPDDKKQNEQWQIHIKVIQINQVSLTNWLLMRDKDAKGEVKKLQTPDLKLPQFKTELITVPYHVTRGFSPRLFNFIY